VVAASSAFPPFLSPAVFQFAADAFKPVDGVDLHTAPFTTNPVLSDGGVNDNLGLEAAKDYDPILVSDASAPLPTLFAPKTRWLGLLRRVLQINTTRVTHMTKHELIAALKAGVKSGTYWGIQADPRNFSGPGAYPFSPELAALAAAVPTRLKALDPVVQELLISWGYAIADASLRKHLDENLPALESLPYALESAADVAAALFSRG
jgi:NTE family protein